MLKLSDNELHWYVANTCRQEKKIKQRLDSMGIENFIPFQQIARKIHGVDKLIEVPVIPNLVFIHTTLKTCMSLIQEYAFDMRYLRDRETGNFLIVPDKQMEDFKQIMDLNPDNISFDNEVLTVGSKVRVMKGNLCGVEGELALEANKTYVIIRIEGVLTASVKVAKSYLKVIS